MFEVRGVRTQEGTTGDLSYRFGMTYTRKEREDLERGKRKDVGLEDV